MKKVLVLMLVLGIASLANATLTLVGDAVDPTMVYIVGEDNGTSGAVCFVSTTGVIDDGTMIYTGSLAGITDYTGLDGDLTAGIDYFISLAADADPTLMGGPSTKILFTEFFDGTSLPPSADGNLASFMLSQGEMYLHSADTLEVIASYVVPEPMTMALLGLGGLFLRRKK